MPHYPRAPITEAVIEIKFSEPVAKEAVDKVQARLRDTYLLIDPWHARTLQVDVGALSASVANQADGYRLNSLDRVDVCLVTTRNFTVSRLAPYTDWEDLFNRAMRNWEEWKRVVGYRKIQRIGVRYINRIDIPTEPGARIELDDYIKCYPEVPELPGFPPIANYAMQLTMPGGVDGCNLIINSSPVSSPLLNHVSLVLDIDISREGEVPQNDDELWNLIARIRGHKNAVFEACVTDRARALFA